MKSLLALCDREGVRFEYENLDSEVRILGVYFRDQEDRPGIILHEVLQCRIPMARTVLGEEYGHHVTFGSGTLFVTERQYDNLVTTIRSEKLAIRWSAEYFMPLDALAYAIVKKGYRHPAELADYFCVIEWLVYRRIEFLQEDIRRRWGVIVSYKELLSPYHASTMWGDSLVNAMIEAAIVGGF